MVDGKAFDDWYNSNTTMLKPSLLLPVWQAAIASQRESLKVVKEALVMAKEQEEAKIREGKQSLIHGNLYSALEKLKEMGV